MCLGNLFLSPEYYSVLKSFCWFRNDDFSDRKQIGDWSGAGLVAGRELVW